MKNIIFHLIYFIIWLLEFGIHSFDELATACWINLYLSRYRMIFILLNNEMDVNIIFKGFNQVTQDEIPHCVNLIIYHCEFLRVCVCVRICVLTWDKCSHLTIRELIHLALHCTSIISITKLLDTENYEWLNFQVKIIIIHQNSFQVRRNVQCKQWQFIIWCIEGNMILH